MRDARTGVCVQTLAHRARKGFSARAQMPDPDPPLAGRDLAEGMGFEPMVGYKPTLDFESSALNQLSHPSLGPENYSSDASAQAGIEH